MACGIIGCLFRVVGSLMLTATLVLYGVTLIRDRDETFQKNFELVHSNARALGLEGYLKDFLKRIPHEVMSQAHYGQIAIGAVFFLATLARPLLGCISRFFSVLAALIWILYVALCESRHLVVLQKGQTKQELLDISLSICLAGSLLIFSSCQSRTCKKVTKNVDEFAREEEEKMTESRGQGRQARRN